MPRPYPATSSSWGLTGVKFALGEGEKERERERERERGEIEIMGR